MSTSAELRPTGTEAVVAILPVKNEEVELSREVSAIELRAESILIENDEEYEAASEFGRELKRAEAKVTAFWKPKKEAAYSAHRLICEGEKEMLAPVTRAIAVLKRTMGGYTQRKESERRIIEAEARRIAQEEADRKLAEAIKAEESGDIKIANSAMREAQIADSMSRNMTVNVTPPKAVGVSQSKDWEVVSIDPAQVPTNFVGVELRPVDEKAVIRLIRSSKGQIQIPGVVYQETVKTSIRR